MLIDTHAHLNQLQLVPKEFHHPIISVSTDLESCKSNQAYSINDQPKIFMACGIHPWFIKDSSLNELNNLFEYMQSNNVRIMGEIGLDFSGTYKSTMQQQIGVLEAQLSFAYKNQLPVSIHLVKAYDAMFELLECYPVQGAIHGFPGSFEQARRFSQQLGIKIGVNGLILRENAPRYKNLVKNLAIESIVLETDAPNIAYPDGTVGDLEMLSLVATKVSQIKNIELIDVIDITTKNAIESFKLNELL